MADLVDASELVGRENISITVRSLVDILVDTLASAHSTANAGLADRDRQQRQTRETIDLMISNVLRTSKLKAAIADFDAAEGYLNTLEAKIRNNSAISEEDLESMVIYVEKSTNDKMSKIRNA